MLNSYLLQELIYEQLFTYYMYIKYLLLVILSYSNSSFNSFFIFIKNIAVNLPIFNHLDLYDHYLKIRLLILYFNSENFLTSFSKKYVYIISVKSFLCGTSTHLFNLCTIFSKITQTEKHESIWSYRDLWWCTIYSRMQKNCSYVNRLLIYLNCVLILLWAFIYLSQTTSSSSNLSV